MLYIGKIVTKIKSNSSKIDGKIFLGLGGFELELGKNERLDFENSFLDEYTINSIKNNLNYKNIFEYEINYEISKIPCSELEQYPNYIRFEPVKDNNLSIEKVLVTLYEYDEQGLPNGNLRNYSAMGITDKFIRLDNDEGLFLGLYKNKHELLSTIGFCILCVGSYF